MAIRLRRPGRRGLAGMVPRLVLAVVLAVFSTGFSTICLTICLTIAGGPRPACADTGARAVRGTVVDERTRRPVSGLIVAVGGERTTTDGTGFFALASVAEVYDLTVADVDGASVSVYRGLRRRDPLLVHQPRPDYMAAVHGAAARGSLSGVGTAAATADVYFLARETDGHGRAADPVSVPTSRPATRTERASSYGPIAVRWDGPDRITGELLALQELPAVARTTGARDHTKPTTQPPAVEAAKDGARWWFARRRLTLASGQALAANLTLSPIPSARLAAEVQVTPGVVLTEVTAFARWPSAHATVPLVSSERAGKSFEERVPDLRAQGATLCLAARGGTGAALEHERCGVTPGARVALALAPAPTLAAPAEGSEARAGTELAWSKAERAIYVLRLEVPAPTPANPNVRLYTAETRTSWPDLSPLGVPFPVGNAIYRCSIGAVGPFTTVDEAVGSQGLGAVAPRESRRAVSRPVRVFVRSHPGS